MSWGFDGGGRGGGGMRGSGRRSMMRDSNWQDDSARKRPGAPLLIPRLVKASFKASPLSTLALVVGAVGGGLITAAELLIGKQIVDALAAALGISQSAAGISVDITAALENPAAAFADVLPWVGWLALAMIGATALELLSQLAEVDVQERVGMRLQREVITKAHSVELVHFEHPTFYDALQRANQDMGPRLIQLLRAMVDVLGSVTGMIAILAVLWQAHWSLAPIMLVGVVPGFWVMIVMRRKAYWVYRIRTPDGRLAMYLSNLLTRRDEAKEVRLFTLARHLMDRWLTLVKRLAVERRAIELKQAWLGALTDVLALAAYSGCLVLVATLVGGARVTVGTFSMLMHALQQFSQRIEQVMRNLTTLHEQSLYLADLYEFLEIDVPVEKDAYKAGAVSPTVPAGVEHPLPQAARIELQDVSFAYPSHDQLVLKRMNLTIEAGERIALIGENGAGKSTLVRIIMGLYQPTAGRVLINGEDVRDLPQEHLRRHFAAVFQEFVRYQFPVADNIRFGRLGRASDLDIRNAASLSGAGEFIEELPEAYGTLLGRPLGGMDLSGGQWQKLAIARALVRQAPVVVLDEPTAALDPKAEAEIYRQFGEMTHGKTSILISHRLGSARLADRVIVLKDGNVVESGSHDQLVAAGGEYAGFFSLQAQWYQ